jgi:hypothetical protein
MKPSPSSESIKNAYSQIVAFEKHVLELKGPSASPWEYVNYKELMQSCLAQLEPVVKQKLPARLLQEAYLLQTNPLFYYEDNVVKYSLTTQKRASELTDIFEKTCKDPSQAMLEDLRKGWARFAETLEYDMQLTRQHFSS